MAKETVRKGKEIDRSVTREVLFEDAMHDSMMPYSEYVILDRALPRVEDGLKPVQRRILYSMHEMGVTPDKPYKKSARIVGDCMGKYHPHGDSSIYGALVKMAQGFNMRMRLVDGHGNFGSVDGDPPAAMRYTEARLSTLALELLRDIDKDTVAWNPNFDDTLKEPVMLPGRFPNLLVNGASGIAVGLATNIPPHNIEEVIDGIVAYIDNPSIKLKDMLKIIKGPDFPTGGFIIPVDPLESIYQTGKGKIKIRARVHIEDDKSNKKNIVITELPYQVSKSELLTRIADLREQHKEILSGISDIVDESDKSGIRAVIKTKREADVDGIAEFLFKRTNLEVNYSVNMVAIADGKPEQMGLMDILRYYVNYQREIIRRRTAFDLKVAKNREEIVKGLLIAIKNIDEVIKIIKTAPSVAAAKAKLRERFDLSEEQAQAIVDMRLKALTRLEVDKLEEELRQLQKRIKELTEILGSKKRQFDVVKGELLEIKKAHRSGRVSIITSGNESFTLPLQDEGSSPSFQEGVLAMNANGELKYMSLRSFSLGAKDIKSLAVEQLVTDAKLVNNFGSLIAFTNKGNFVRLKIDEFPEKRFKDKGFKLGQYCPDAQKDERVVKFFFSDRLIAGDLLFFTKNGIVKRTDYNEYNNLTKDYLQAIVLSDDDEVINVELLDENKYIIAITERGMTLAFTTDQVPVQGRKAGGVRGIKLADGDKVLYMGQTDDEGEVVVVTDKGCAKRVITSTIKAGNRYLKGVKIAELVNSKVAGVTLVKNPIDIALITEGGIEVVNTDNIRIDARTTKGKQITKQTVLGIVAHKMSIN